jgi:hypothetical protein
MNSNATLVSAFQRGAICLFRSNVLKICSLFLLLNISLQAQVTVNATRVNPSCFGYTNGSATATATGGTAPYRYQWSNGNTGASITGLGSGSFVVTATDASNRTSTATVTLTAPAAINISTTSANICAGGAVTASATGGTSPYTYNWGNGRTGAVQNNLPGGGYQISVTDANGCTGTRFVVVPSAFTLSLRIGELQCFGDCDAAIDALPAGGTGPFTYLWNTGQTTQSIVGVPSGTYSVRVTDANGCVANAGGTVVNPPQIQISTSIVSPSCGGGANGSATAVATGRAPFTYQWSNGQTGATATNLNVGTYQVTVVDARGCRRIAEVIVPSRASFTLAIAKVDASCANNNGTASVAVTGGTAPYTYRWSNTRTTASISGLSAGNYTVTVTDASGCSNTATTTVNAAGNLNIALVKTDAACGIANGTVKVSAANGTAPYRYLWSTGATIDSIKLLGAGTYSVTVTDAAGCTAISSATVGQSSSFMISIDARNIKCNGDSDGQATAMVMGGSAPYTYRWSNNGTVAVQANLTAGSYTVSVTDAAGCTGTQTTQVSQPTLLVVSSAATGSSCSGNTGSVNSTVSGGTSGYTYLWSNGAATPNLANVGAGPYTLTVTDANGCIKITSATVTAQGSTLAVTSTQTNASCGNANGAIVTSVTGGRAPYTYLWSNTATSANLSSIGAGVYNLVVTDANGCTATLSATITNPGGATVTLTKTDVSCLGGNTGSVTSTVTGGRAPYVYLWSNTATSANLTNVGAGTYTLTVTDANGCAKITSATVSAQSSTLAASVSAQTNATCGSANGAVTIAVIGGTAPYTYIWSNMATTANLANVVAGTYNLTVTDANRCTVTLSATITNTGGANVSVTKTDVSCFGGSNGTVNTTVTGGRSPYTYLWSNNATTANLSNVAAGTYRLTVTDASGCFTYSSAIVEGPASALVAVAQNSTNVLCNAGNNGSARASATGGTAPYTFRWNNSATTAQISNLVAGTYRFTATDANGCTASREVVIAQPDVLALTFNNTNASCLPNGAARAVVTGGTSPYTYRWSNSVTTANNTNILGGNYSVTVTDASGCTLSGTTTLGSATSTVGATISVLRQISYQGAGDGEVKANPSGGTAPFTYLWSTSATTMTISNLPGGTYTVTITDALGCTATERVTLVEPVCNNVVNPGTITGNQTFCAQSELTAITESSAPTGGSGALEYMWMYSTETSVFNANTWRTIGVNAPNLNDLPQINTTTYFIRCVRRAGCSEFKESNVVTKTPIINSTYEAPTTACINRDYVFSAADNGAGATYFWTFGPFSSVSSSSARTVTVRYTVPGTRIIRLAITKGTCIRQVEYNLNVANCSGGGQISAFSVTPQGRAAVDVIWATQNELETSRYLVERADDGKNFTTIGEISSQNGAENLYKFVDKTPKMGRAFYRIKQVMPASDPSFSAVKQTLIYHNGEESIMAYPNPARDVIYVERLENNDTEGEVKIFSESGKAVRLQKIDKNQTRYEISTEGLATGLYLLKVQNADGSFQTVKFFKE